MVKSTQDQIRQLRRRRAQELRNANYLFSRFKRDTRQALSPDRAIRRNIGLAMVGAAAVGMILAPGPRRNYTRHRERAEREGALGTLMKLLDRLPAKAKRSIPGLEDAVAEAREAAATERERREEQPRRSRSLLSVMLMEAVPLLAAKIPWQQIIGGYMKGRASAGHSNGHPGDEATVVIADAGTKPTSEPLPDI